MTCKLMTAYTKLNQSVPTTWVQFCAGEYKAITNTGYWVLISKDESGWFVNGFDHEPKEMFTGDEDHPPQGFKTLKEAKAFADRWIEEYDRGMVDYFLECPAEYWAEWESDNEQVRNLKDAYVLAQVKERPCVNLKAAPVSIN